MSGLFDRVSDLFARGHATEPPQLWQDPRLHGDEEFTSAAVLIAMTDRADPGILLLHRPSNMRAHPGQIAFPGGKLEPGETAVSGALREAHEELGIRCDDVRVIGASDLYQTGSGYEVTPVLGVVPADIRIHPNPAEVAQWFEAPAAFLLDPANHRQQSMEWEGRPHTFLEITWQDHVIWGVTAAIISNLSKRLIWRD